MIDMLIFSFHVKFQWCFVGIPFYIPCKSKKSLKRVKVTETNPTTHPIPWTAWPAVDFSCSQRGGYLFQARVRCWVSTAFHEEEWGFYHPAIWDIQPISMKSVSLVAIRVGEWGFSELSTWEANRLTAYTFGIKSWTPNHMRCQQTTKWIANHWMDHILCMYNHHQQHRLWRWEACTLTCVNVYRMIDDSPIYWLNMKQTSNRRTWGAVSTEDLKEFTHQNQ